MTRGVIVNARWAAVLLLVSTIAVLSLYGWYAALNAVLPFLGGVLWAAVLGLAAWGAGTTVTRRFGPLGPQTLENAVLLLFVGSVVLMVCAAALALLHLFRALPLLIVLAAWACVGAVRFVRHLPAPVAIRLPSDPSWLVLLLAGGFSLAAATTFAPFYDQWHYHLGFPYHWLRAGTVITFEQQAYSFFPANMGLLFSYALSGPGGWGAQVVHWSMGALAAAGTAALAGRLGATTSYRLMAPALFLAAPATIQIGALAGADLGVAAFTIGAVLGALRIRDEPERATRWAAASGMFAGVAAGCKYLALATIVLPAAVLVVVLAAGVAGNRLTRRTVTAATVFGLAAATVVSPWMLRNVAEAGNPIHPYFADIFRAAPSEAATTDNDVASEIGGFALDAEKIGSALTMGTFSRRGHAGDIGPVFLILTPLVVVWIWQKRRDPRIVAVGVFAVLGTLAWATGPPLGRYLLPILAVVAALAAAAWSELVGKLVLPVKVVLKFGLFLLLVGNCNPFRGEYLPHQLRCFLGAEETSAYLAANCTQFEPFTAANRLLPAEARVLLVGEPRPFGIDRDVVVEDAFRTPLLVGLARDAESVDDIAVQLRDLGVTHILWNAAEAQRIAATGGRDDYLGPLGPDAQQRLRTYLSEFTVPVATGEWWEIVELRSR